MTCRVPELFVNAIPAPPPAQMPGVSAPRSPTGMVEKCSDVVHLHVPSNTSCTKIVRAQIDTHEEGGWVLTDVRGPVVHGGISIVLVFQRALTTGEKDTIRQIAIAKAEAAEEAAAAVKAAEEAAAARAAQEAAMRAEQDAAVAARTAEAAVAAAAQARTAAEEASKRVAKSEQHIKPKSRRKKS